MRPHSCKPMPDAALRRRALERNRGEFVRGQKQFGNRLSYSTRMASAFFELPSAIFSFTGVADKSGDARSFCGVVCPRCELCSLCYAEKHCRFCCYKAKRFNPPHSLRRYAAQGVGKRSRPQILLSLFAYEIPFPSWLHRAAAYPRCSFL